MNRLFFIPLFLLCILSCNQDKATNDGSTENKSKTGELFTLLPSSSTGIDFRNDLNEDVTDENKNILSFDYYFNGAGVAIGDINNDDLPDIFFSGNEVNNKLYLNKGNMKFEDISEKAGVNQGKKWGNGVTMADVNGDGNLDIYLTQGGSKFTPWSDKKNLLLINNGDLTFTESAEAYGLADENIGTQSAFFDYDKDGDLDCFILNESKYTLVTHDKIFKDLKIKKNLEQASSQLYRNDNGKFTNVTEAAGVLNWGFGLGLAVSDINDDGWPDVYVANDYSVPDFVYINNGDGTFTDQVKDLTKQISFYSMGVDIADMNNDGLKDIAVVDMAADDHIRDKTLMASMDIPTFWYYINTRNYHYQYMFNALQINNGNGTFSNIANMAGVSRTDWSWASLLADFDNDGHKDFFVSNGFRRYARDNDFRIAMEKSREANGGTVPFDQRQKFYDMMPTIKLPNRMYRNDGNLKFIPVEEEWGTAQPSFSNGAAYADLDLDGDLDLVVNNVAMEAFIYKNNADSKRDNNYFRVKLKGADTKMPIATSQVTIHYDDKIQVQELMNTRGYQSAVEDILHFGMGKYTKIDKVEIKWANGKTQILNDVATNQQLTVVYDATKSIATNNNKKTNNFITKKDAAALGVEFVHTENTYDDFEKEILLPQKQSTQGPHISVADVNADGLDDFFIGGAAGQSGLLYLQQQNGTFSYTAENQVWALDKNSEDIGSLFYDADGDGDLDLYVVSGGGGEFATDAPELLDRLYINVGQGKFQKLKQGLPEIFASGSVVKAADYDNDGDMDLFVGGRGVPGKYPYASRSYILEFDKFKYKDVTAEVAPDLMQPGLVTDFEWTDFNNDKQMDLVVVGEWMPISFYKNDGGKFTNVSEAMGTDNLKGWWYSITTADVDNDGDLDLICGNLGTNSKFSASKKKPFNVFSDDFDKNGSCDIVLSKEYNGKLVPARGRQCSSEQMPFIKDKFPTYKEFASADIEDILGKDKLNKSLHLQVTDFESKVLINNGDGTYTAQALPAIAQMAPINGIIVKDVNKDGNLDLITAGNMYNTEVETPRYDAGTGLVMLGDGKGKFDALKAGDSGFFTQENVKDINWIKQKDGKAILAVAVNNGPMQFFEYDDKAAQMK